MWRAVVLMHRDIESHILFYSGLCHALFGCSSAGLCTCLDCCMHTDCSAVSQLRASSKTGAKVKNSTLENKHNMVWVLLFFFFCQRQIHKMLLAAAFQAGIRTQKHTMAQTPWFSRFLSCFVYKCIFGCKISCLLFPREYF